LVKLVTLFTYKDRPKVVFPVTAVTEIVPKVICSHTAETETASEWQYVWYHLELQQTVWR